MNYLSNSFLKHCLKLNFLDDLPNFDAMGKEENTLIVIDDYMNEASNLAQVQSLFTRGRHLGLSVIYLAKNLFHKGKYTRDFSLNMAYNRARFQSNWSPCQTHVSREIQNFQFGPSKMQRKNRMVTYFPT